MCGTLGVANISNFFLIGYASYVVDLCWSIDGAHLAEAEVPVVEVLHLVWVEPLVLAAIFGASLVTKPHVVALFGEGKSWSYGLLIDNPAVCGGQEAML